MNAIIGMSGLLLDTDAGQRAARLRRHDPTSGDALLTIINDILDFSKIEAGKVDLEHEPFDLRRAVEGALDVLAPVAAERASSSSTRSTTTCPALVGDAGRLRQILLNLLSNAVKFTERGEVDLRSTAREWPGRGRPGDTWEIEIDVRDTGIGIPRDRMDRLFQSFSQVDASIARRYGGTGLGLAISRRLAELMDGSLDAESTGVAGEGSDLPPRVRATRRRRSFPSSAAVGGPRRAARADRRRQRHQPPDPGRAARPLGHGRERHGLARRGPRLARAPASASTWRSLDLFMPEHRRRRPGRWHPRRGRGGGRLRPRSFLSSVGGRERRQTRRGGLLAKPVKPSALHDARHAVLAARWRRAGRAAAGGLTAAIRPEPATSAAHPPGRGQRGQPEAGVRVLLEPWATPPTSPATAARSSTPSSAPTTTSC